MKQKFKKSEYDKLRLQISIEVFDNFLDSIRESFLVDFYVKNISMRMSKTIEIIPMSVMDALQNYHWLGNVRELKTSLNVR